MAEDNKNENAPTTPVAPTEATPEEVEAAFVEEIEELTEEVADIDRELQRLRNVRAGVQGKLDRVIVERDRQVPKATHVVTAMKFLAASTAERQRRAQDADLLSHQTGRRFKAERSRLDESRQPRAGVNAGIGNKPVPPVTAAGIQTPPQK